MIESKLQKIVRVSRPYRFVLSALVAGILLDRLMTPSVVLERSQLRDVWPMATFQTGALIVDTTAIVGGNTLIKDQSISGGYTVDANDTFYINPVGFNGSTTRFEHTEIDDGKGSGAAHAMLYADASIGNIGIKTLTPSAQVALEVNGATLVDTWLAAKGRISFCASGADNCSGQAESIVYDTSGSETHQQISELTGVSRGFTVLRHDHMTGAANPGVLQLQESVLDGTVDTTAAAVQTYAGEFDALATRSAGANILGNVALLASASGGQENYALLSNAGDIRMNVANTATLGATNMASFSTTGLADMSAASAIKLNANITSNVNTIPGTSSVTPQLSIGVAVNNSGSQIQVKNTVAGQAVNGVEALADTTVNANQSVGYFLSRGAGGGGGFNGATASGLAMLGTSSSIVVGGVQGDVCMFTDSKSLVFAADHTSFTTATRLTPSNHWAQDTSVGAPSLDAGCTSGASSAIAGNDNAFKLTTGATSTACTLTFAKTWTIAPVCIVLGEAGATHTETVTATTIVFSANQSAKVYNIMCQGTQGAT